MSRQIGLFFLLIGLLGLVLFLGTFREGEILWFIGFLSIVSAVMGIFLTIRSRPSPPPEERFRSWRKYKEGRKEKKKKKE